MMLGYLKYIVENCTIAFDKLCETNRELHEAMRTESTGDINRLGALNRMIQDYLVIRVAGLFDKDVQTISLHNAFPKSGVVKKIEADPIIKKILENRNRFVAHSDFVFLKKEKFIIPTNEICSSNIRDLLEKFETMLSETESINSI